jgi:hypothetical protein
VEFPLDTFTGLLSGHLETFRKLEGLQKQALDGMKNQGVEGLAAMLASQQEVLLSIAREKAQLKPYLDAWEKLEPGRRSALRQGKAGEILDALEEVAKGIQARHADWFGEEPDEKSGGGGDGGKSEGQDLSQTINFYRSQQ